MKVLVVDDSALLRNILRQVLQEKSDIAVVAEASNGEQAVKLCESAKPDLVIMDINMPVMDGIAATAEIMKRHPLPILILSSALDSANSFRALKSGALEVMAKPDIDQFNNPLFYKSFIEKIRALVATTAKGYERQPSHTENAPQPNGSKSCRMIVMGASTGGPLTVCSILEKLPPEYPFGIALVQHLESGFDKSFAEWLASETHLKIKIASAGDLPSAGEVFIAPTGFHLAVRGGRISLEDGPPVLNQKPSVDVLFKTAAEWFGPNLIGVLLVSQEDKLQVMNRESIKLRDRLIPLVSLQILIGKSDTSIKDISFALVVESLGNVIAISIDSILEYTTLIFKALPKNLGKLSGVQGIVFDEDYNIVTILHVPALIERSKRLTDVELKARRSGVRKSDYAVLVIEDSLNSREIQKSILESAGYTVAAAEDGIEGLELLRTRQFHLVITDLSMPRMDGFTLIENMKRDRSLREIPVIVVSAYDDADSANRARNLGAEKFIVKSSFDRSNLVEAVDALLSRRGEGNG